jgi:uncharacterized protein
MMKVILSIVVVVIGVFWWRNQRRSANKQADPVAAPVKPSAKPQGATEMVRCAHCGVHLPRPDAIAQETLLYCSRAHQIAGPKA